jgi:hypothetical protein
VIAPTIIPATITKSSALLVDRNELSQECALMEELSRLGQGHIFAGWPEPGVQLLKKLSILETHSMAKEHNIMHIARGSRVPD